MVMRSFQISDANVQDQFNLAFKVNQNSVFISQTVKFSYSGEVGRHYRTYKSCTARIVYK